MTTNRNFQQPHLTVIQNEKRNAHEAKDAFIISYDEYIHKSNSEGFELFLRDLAQNFFCEGYQAGFDRATEKK